MRGLTSKIPLLACLALAGALATGCGDAKSAVVDPIAAPALRAISVVGCDTGLRLEFVGDLDPKTVTSKSFYVERSAGVAAYDLAGRAITFTPDEPFQSGQTYAAVLSGDVASIGGTPLGASLRWSFSCFDQTPPVVMERFPQGEGVSLLVRPTVRFSKPIDEKSLTLENLHIDGHPVAITYSPGERTATLTPTYPLYPGRKYVVTVGQHVRDLSGNELGVTVTWSFRTRPASDDWAAKLISPPVPASTACDASIALRLSPDFKLAPAGVPDAPIAIDGIPNLATSYDADSRVVTVTPTSIPFRRGITYQLVATGTLLDEAGDTPFDAGSIVGTFTIVSHCDDPTVADVPVYAGTLDCAAPVAVRFSTMMESGPTLASLKLQDLTLGGDDLDRAPVVPSSSALSENGFTATLQPDEPLEDGHRYWISVSGDAQSVVGKPLMGTGGWEFAAICP